ncbi:MAG: YigZ family protein [Sulfurovum sp.]|nr:YigZ family protein [Sulfurovum sp.]
MKFVQEEFSNTIEIKKSKFIAHLIAYDKFDARLQTLKKEHPKARHFIYAYRYLNEFNQVVENCSDDGEPKNSSGKPSLRVLSGEDVINSAVIIIRYFGGVKLGVGGLIRAYIQAVNEVCKNAKFCLYQDLQTKTITLEHSELSKILYKIKQLDIQILNKEFTNRVTLTLQASKEKLDLI